MQKQRQILTINFYINWENSVIYRQMVKTTKKSFKEQALEQPFLFYGRGACFTEHLSQPKCGRNVTKKVVKFLPAIFKHLINNVYVSSYNPPPILVINKIKPINKISSKSLQDLLKTTFNKSKPFTINSKYNLMCDGILEEKGTWFNLWKIKNPHLRNYRSKVAYKDVYSQERRFKFRLNDSPQCRICKNRVESVQHQLFECRNAQRMWQIYVDMFADNISFKNLVCVGNFPAAEIVKATIIKLLIQIDRSEHLAIHQIYLRIIQMLTLEASITKDPIYTNLVNLLSKNLITTSSDNASD